MIMKNILMKTQGFIYHSFISIVFLRVFLVRYCLLTKHAVSMLFGEKSETLEGTLGKKFCIIALDQLFYI